MVVEELVTINGKAYKYTYSNKGYMIERNGVQYSEAIDPIKTERTYLETCIPNHDIMEVTEDLYGVEYEE